MPHSIPLAICVAFLGLYSRLVTADITPVYPPALRENDGPLSFDHNQKVNFQWESTFDLTTVELYQGPGGEGRYGVQALVTNVTNSSSPEFKWIARSLPGHNNSQPFHLYIYNAENPNCGACHGNSSFFSINARDVNGGGGRRHKKALKLGLGLGLGLGIPLILVLTGLATWFCLRRRRHRKSRLSAASPTGTGEQSMDWKQPPEHPENHGTDYHAARVPKHAEVDGTQIAEMPHHQIVSEAPDASVGADRVELEGDPAPARAR